MLDGLKVILGRLRVTGLVISLSHACGLVSAQVGLARCGSEPPSLGDDVLREAGRGLPVSD